MLRSVKSMNYYRSYAGAMALFRGRAPCMAVRNITTERIPSPPKLPREEQEEFEKLQRIASSQEAIDQYNVLVAGDHTKES